MPVSALLGSFSAPSPDLRPHVLNLVPPRFRRQGRREVIAPWEDDLMNRTPGNCKKVNLDEHADHDVYKNISSMEINDRGDQGKFV